MKVIDIGAEFDGALLELSRVAAARSGKPACSCSTVTGEAVLVRTEFFEIEGSIRAVRPEGYGMQFFGEVDRRCDRSHRRGVRLQRGRFVSRKTQLSRDYFCRCSKQRVFCNSR